MSDPERQYCRFSRLLGCAPPADWDRLTDAHAQVGEAEIFIRENPYSGVSRYYARLHQRYSDAEGVNAESSGGAGEEREEEGGTRKGGGAVITMVNLLR